MEPFASTGSLKEPLVSHMSTSPDAGRRHYHDVAWLGLFALWWAGMGVIAWRAFQEGDLARLRAGMDQENHLCGKAEPGQYDLTSTPYVYFACLQYGLRSPTVCKSSCPDLSGHYVHWYNGTIITCIAHG